MLRGSGFAQVGGREVPHVQPVFHQRYEVQNRTEENGPESDPEQFLPPLYHRHNGMQQS